MKAGHTAWINLWLDAWLLTAEASAVAGLRLAKIQTGGTAGSDEASRMIYEKMKAALDLQAMAVAGGLGTTMESASAASLRHYRTIVRRNYLRLSRGR